MTVRTTYYISFDNDETKIFFVCFCPRNFHFLLLPVLPMLKEQKSFKSVKMIQRSLRATN